MGGILTAVRSPQITISFTTLEITSCGKKRGARFTPKLLQNMTPISLIPSQSFCTPYTTAQERPAILYICILGEFFFIQYTPIITIISHTLRSLNSEPIVGLEEGEKKNPHHCRCRL